jgi:signal transduction histidine kinase
MIASGSLPKDEIIKSAGIIKSQSERMTQIIRQLLDFTRRDKPRYGLTNILSLIKQVFEILMPMAKKQNVTLELRHTEKIQLVLRMDANQIQQVLINLIMNSIQAMPTGGSIIVDVSIKDPDSLNTLHTKHYLNIKISDDGDGISDENIVQIFDPFFSTKKVGEGTGLGLPIAQGIIEEHSGWLEVESIPGKGTTFHVYLPMENILPLC